MNTEFPEDSDTSDDDYVPTGPGAGEDVPSEVDSDGDSEDPLSDTEDLKSSKRRKRSKKSKVPEAPKEETVEDTKKLELTEEAKKKHADDLWASFKKDAGFKSKSSSGGESSSSKSSLASSKEKETNVEKPLKNTSNDTVKVTQIFEFAGEEVKVEKEVSANSAEARLSGSRVENSPAPKRKGGLGGIGSVLSQIGKKQKLSTLEKSKLDWNSYKQREDIEEELESYRKGKDGYLEKQDFLQRADLRRFEIEREVRTIERNKRLNMNNVP